MKGHYKMGNKEGIIDECLAHRYLYYVLGNPVIDDHIYDIRERRAIQLVKSGHELRKPGSSLASSYEPHVIKLAERLLKEEEERIHCAWRNGINEQEEI